MKRPSLQHPIRSGGFTLIELLVVIAIALILSALAIPAISSLKKANDINLATTGIAALLAQGRSYAMANNTYVFVCLEETDASIPATQAQSAGTGRVAVQVFSSTDGTLNYTTSNLSAVSRLQIFSNVHLPQSLTSTTGTLSGRPSATYIVGNSGYPVSATSVASGNFSFTKVIAFDSQGEIHIPATSPATGFQTGLSYLEIDLQESNGNTVSTTSKDFSAIQVDGLTGAVTTYRS